MKKIAYMIAALPLALFAKSASADISVSGSATAAYTDAGGNASSTFGGGVSFSMSTTTDGGVSISASSAIGNDSDSVGSGSQVTGVTALTFGFANGSITIAQEVSTPDGKGKVGELVSYADDNQVAKTASVGLTEDEGDGISVSTSIGDMSLSATYVYDGLGGGNIDGAANTAAGASLSMAIGGGTLTLATADEDISGVNNTEFGAAYVMSAAGGTLSLGFTGTDGDTAAKEGEAVSAAYSTSLGGASVAIGYTGHDANNKTSNQTDVTLSSSLGGGASIFAEYTNVSGDISASSSTKDATVIAIGTSISF
jgi:hypothetical protein